MPKFCFWHRFSSCISERRESIRDEGEIKGQRNEFPPKFSFLSSIRRKLKKRFKKSNFLK